MIFKKTIILLATTATIYAGQNNNLLNEVSSNNKDITRLNEVIVILIDKVNKLTDTQKVLLNKLNITDDEVSKVERVREEKYAQKLLELKKLKEENKKAEEELKSFVKNEVNKKAEEDLSKTYKKDIPKIKTPAIVKKDNLIIIKKEESKVVKVVVKPEIKEEIKNIAKDGNKTVITVVKPDIKEDVNTTVKEDVNTTVKEDVNVKKYIIKLETTTEKRKKVSERKINKIENKDLRENIIIRPVGKNKLIVETKIGYDYNTTQTNLLEYKKLYKHTFVVSEDKDRLNTKMVYVIYLGTLKSEKEKGYILRRIKNKKLKEGISIISTGKRYVAVTKDYNDYKIMKKDLKKYRKYFKTAYMKKEKRKIDGK